MLSFLIDIFDIMAIGSDEFQLIYSKIEQFLGFRPNPENSNFCFYPFFQVLMTANGKYKPCCKFSDHLTDKGRELDVSSDSLEDAWNADSMKAIRDAFNANKKLPGCSECWREEASGIKPMRYDSFGYAIPMQQVRNLNSPLRLEINASNVCNLKCRICSSFASTKWMAEEKELFGKSEGKHINLNKVNFDIIKKWLPNIKEFGLFGGEPFLSEEILDLLRFCVGEGYAKKITILVNTNSTVYSEEIVELLKSFKKVYLNFSIDDIGDRFEYQRKGAKWTSVLENMKKYLQHGGTNSSNKIVCKISCTISILNVFYLPEYFIFFNKEFPGLKIFLNLLYDPSYFNAQILPKEIKEHIIDRLKTRVVTTYKTDELETKSIRSVISYLQGEVENNMDGFFESIDRHDKFRKEKFSRTFPEIWNLIESYQVNSRSSK